MTIELMIRSRPTESISVRHNRLMSLLTSLAADWGLRGTAWPTIPDPGNQWLVARSLSRFLLKDVKGEVRYQNRKDVADDAHHDDYFTLVFDPTYVQADFAHLVTSVFAKYLEAFQAYVGYVADQVYTMRGWRAQVKLEKKRSGVYRFYPVSFFDEEHCKKAFTLSRKEIAARVKPHVEAVKLTAGGVLVIATSSPVAVEECEVINEKLMALFRSVKKG